MKSFVGIFGGTFDPVHMGHFNALNDLSQNLKFSRIHWVLSARPPHKDSPLASIEQRFSMLQLALEDSPLYTADDSEIKRKETSYTIDTVELFHECYPQSDLCLIIGGDSLLKLHTWHRYQDLIEQVHIIVLARPGYELLVPEFLKGRTLTSCDQLASAKQPSLVIFEQTNYAISSTHIRELLLGLQRGDITPQALSDTQQQLQKMLPEKVINYIQYQQSYKISLMSTEKMNPEKIKDEVISALEAVKGQDIRVIEIADISDFADYMVVASGTSDTHVKALAREASDSLRKQGVIPLSEDGRDIGEWVLVDFGDVVLHVMRPEVREYYDLEKLWDHDVRELVKKHREEQDTQAR